MATSSVTEQITESDEQIREALEEAFLPALLPALAQATGDLSLLRDDLRPPGVTPGIPQGGMSDEQQREARALALDAIRRLRDDAPRAAAHPIEGDIREITRWMTGSAAADEYIPLLVEELAPYDDDPRAPAWQMDPKTRFSVAIIGAGMSGILAGIRLKQAGVPFVIFEKNDDVGGTWLENTYPGARVDVPNAFYSYSFAQRTDWPKHFSTQEVLLEYFRDCAREYGVREHVRFRTEVASMAFNEARGAWALRLRAADGAEETVEAQAVISAVGQLNRPKLPEIAGREGFGGASFHSARWDHGVELRGKRVAVIGTGASSAQFIPVVAQEAAELTIYQRTPNWFVPVPNYHEDVGAGLRWLFARVPHYAHWYRFWLFWNTTDGLLPAATVDPAWEPRERSVSAANEQLRVLLTMYLQGQYADRPDLLEKVLPTYPPTSKRIVLDNGVWAETLKRDNVRLITDTIREITRDGVVTADGTERAADVIIYGTGFQASHFLTPMRVTGRDGIDLNAQWDGDARAYLGITVPNFPNFFMLYGPNTNIVVNGSIIYFSECEVRYVMGCLRLLLEGGRRTMDCRADVHDAYNERIDRANLERTWGVSTVNSWYKNAKGRSAQNWPFNLIEYWQRTREPDAADYVFA
ncbi:MAG TPA: NAD(P)/FAD-dependent oxidoreductase [Dehalococcoidia bacterium]|nr:NAD(P)/FAD-dependent oxidoreductase [Dehalococcoidia bacterium]